MYKTANKANGQHRDSVALHGAEVFGPSPGSHCSSSLSRFWRKWVNEGQSSHEETRGNVLLGSHISMFSQSQSLSNFCPTHLKQASKTDGKVLIWACQWGKTETNSSHVRKLHDNQVTLIGKEKRLLSTIREHFSSLETVNSRPAVHIQPLAWLYLPCDIIDFYNWSISV